MVAVDAPSKHPKTKPVAPPLLMRSAEVARQVGVTKPAVGDAVRLGRLRPVALLMPVAGARRAVPLFAADAVAEWAARRLALEAA